MGGALTVGAVLAWDTTAPAQDADRVHQAGVRLGDVVEEITRTRRRMGEDWLGPAAEAASRRFAQQSEDGETLRQAVRQAERALEEGHHRLRGVRDRLQSAVEAARREECTVGEDGSVQPPAVPAVSWPAGTPVEQAERLQHEYDQQLRHAYALAEHHEAAVRGALHDAQVADTETAAEIRAVSLPEEMSSRLVGQARAAEGMVTFPAGWSPRAAFRVGTPAEWTQAVGYTLAQCLMNAHLAGNPDLADQATGYYGGGFIEGPDGRSYPLVVPRLVEDGEAYGANRGTMEHGPEDLGGADTGWHTTGMNAGYEQLERVSKLDQTGAIIGGAAMGPVDTTGEFIRRPDLERHLSVGPQGVPSLSSTDAVSPAPPPEPPSTPPGSERGAVGYHPERMGRAGSLLALGINSTQGVQAAQSMEADAHHPYVLTLQEHEDGRRRAIMNVYEVFEHKRTGDVTIQSSHGWIDEEGSLQQDEINFRVPDHGTVGPSRPSYDVDP